MTIDRRTELLAQLHTACQGHEIEDCVYVLATLLADTILADASDDLGVAFKQLDSAIVLMQRWSFSRMRGSAAVRHTRKGAGGRQQDR